MSLFGEIVEPVSRTAWEDWDELTGLDSNSNGLQWIRPFEIPNAIETFFILEGKFLSDCAKQSPSTLLSVNSITVVNLHLYKIKDNSTYVCAIREYDLVLSSEIVELLKPLIVKSKNIISVQTKPMPEYQSMTLPTQSYIVRNLSSTKPSLVKFKHKYEKLEQPNIITGVSAGVVSIREHMDSTATAFVFYSEQCSEMEIPDIQNVLGELNIFQHCRGKTEGVLSSNLYI